jgi:hypothetical protein
MEEILELLKSILKKAIALIKAKSTKSASDKIILKNMF